MVTQPSVLLGLASVLYDGVVSTVKDSKRSQESGKQSRRDAVEGKATQDTYKQPQNRMASNDYSPKKRTER
jgi:hypothetical protein